MNSSTEKSRHPITASLLQLIRGTCYHPDDLEVEESQNGKLLRIDFAAHSADSPILIGRLGRQSKALRFIAKEMGKRVGIDVDVQMRDSYRGIREGIREFKPNALFSNDEFLDVLRPMLELLFGQVPPMEFRDINGKDCLIIDLPKQQSTITQAIADAFYPFSIRNGRKLRILNKNYEVDTV